MKWNFHIKINFIILTRMINIRPPSAPHLHSALDKTECKGGLQGGGWQGHRSLVEGGNDL